MLGHWCPDFFSEFLESALGQLPFWVDEYLGWRARDSVGFFCVVNVLSSNNGNGRSLPFQTFFTMG